MKLKTGTIGLKIYHDHSINYDFIITINLSLFYFPVISKI